MIIVFDGNTLDLLKHLQQWSGNDEIATIDFILKNFEMLQVTTIGESNMLEYMPITKEEVNAIKSRKITKD